MNQTKQHGFMAMNHANLRELFFSFQDVPFDAKRATNHTAQRNTCHLFVAQIFLGKELV